MWPRKPKRSGRHRASPRAGQPPRRIARRAIALAAVPAALLAGLWALNRPILTVTVTGRFQHVTPPQIERTVARAVHGAGLITVSLTDVRRAIEALPWVACAGVQRAWPHGLDVWVREQHAAAVWDGDGLLNARGVLFLSPVHAPAPGLARLSGPKGAQARLMRRFLAMQKRLAPSGLAITALSLDASGAWRFALSDRITVRLGRSRVEDRFDRFMSAALGIVERRAAAISYVDMRYTNGFAIGWREGDPKNATASERWHARPAVPSGLLERLAQPAPGPRGGQEGCDA